MICLLVSTRHISFHGKQGAASEEANQFVCLFVWLMNDNINDVICMHSHWIEQLDKLSSYCY